MRPSSTGCDAVPTRTPLRSTRIAPGGSGFGAASSTVTGPSFDPQIADHGPCARVRSDRADPPLDDMGGQVPAHPGVVDGDLRCDGDAVGRLRHRRQRPVGDAVQRRLQQRGTRNRQPVKQIPRGVGRPDRLGDHAVDRPGVQGGFDLERGGAGDRVACRDRRLHRRRAAPRGQQREMQVDPAVLRARPADRRGAARRRPRPRMPRAPIPPAPQTNSSELGRSGRSTGMPCSSASCATGDGDGLARRPAAASGRVEHGDHLMARRVDEPAQ